MTTIDIVKVEFKYMKNGERLWNSEECRNYLYHLGLKPNQRVIRKDSVYTYIIKDVIEEEEPKLKMMKDDNQISLFYLE
tara:strand:+ start:166 stop:402 length:237 start_codon:yes stop_codon:yes gene_type:complete